MFPPALPLSFFLTTALSRSFIFCLCIPFFFNFLLLFSCCMHCKIPHCGTIKNYYYKPSSRHTGTRRTCNTSHSIYLIKRKFLLPSKSWMKRRAHANAFMASADVMCVKMHWGKSCVLPSFLIQSLCLLFCVHQEGVFKAAVAG